MGYDMYMIGKSYGDGDEYYFRLNCSAMAKTREVMLSLEIVRSCGWPKWPKWPGDDHFDDENDPTTDEGAAYRASESIFKSEGDDPVPPVHKFCSNDGWVITAKGCQAMLDMATGHDVDLPWWGEWLQFIEASIGLGGFEVH